MKISDTKKLAAITAALFITVTAFSGCSESANSSQTTSSVSQAAKSDIDASIAAGAFYGIACVCDMSASANVIRVEDIHSYSFALILCNAAECL